MKLPSCALPSAIVASDAHDVAGVLLGEVVVFVDECLAHAGGVFGIHAKDDGLLEAVAALFEIVRYPFGDTLRALINDQIAIEVFLVVDAVFDLVAMQVGLALCRGGSLPHPHRDAL